MRSCILSASCLQVLTVCCALAPFGYAWRHSALRYIGGAWCLCIYYLARILYTNRPFLPVQSAFHIAEHLFAISGDLWCVLLIRSPWHQSYHGVWGYFLQFLSSESSVSEPPISASAFGYLGVLRVYRLIPSVYRMFGSVRMYVLQVWYLSYSFLLVRFNMRYIYLPDLTVYRLCGSWHVRANRPNFSLCAWCWRVCYKFVTERELFIWTTVHGDLFGSVCCLFARFHSFIVRLAPFIMSIMTDSFYVSYTGKWCVYIFC